MASGLRLIGGFAGLASPDPDARDPETFTSVLESDLIVVAAPPNGAPTEFDGVRFSGGSNWAVRAEETSLVLRRCTFNQHAGVGIHLEDGDVRLEQCVFRGTRPYGVVTGPLIYSFRSHVTLLDSVLQDGLSTGGSVVYCEFSEVLVQRLPVHRQCGGDRPPHGRCRRAIAARNGSVVTIQDSEFSGNRSELDGGAVHQTFGTLRFERCRFEDNIAERRGGAVMMRRAGSMACRARFWTTSPGPERAAPSRPAT